LYVKDYKLLYSIIEKKDFFYNLCPISGSIKWFQKLIDDERFLTMVVTQPPRTCDFAVGDKRRWIKTYFPNFDLTNIIFTHKKFLIKGDVLFDDCADHLFNWNMNNVKGITAKILYPYNNNMPADWTFNDKNKAWEEFYYKLDKQFK
jgi:5'(3')-deoxyribonucleotidase